MSKTVTQGETRMIDDMARWAVIDALGARLGLDHDALVGLVVNTRQLVNDRARLDKLSGARELDQNGLQDHAADIAVAILSDAIARAA